jgi:hypothetical protein
MENVILHTRLRSGIIEGSLVGGMELEFRFRFIEVDWRFVR